MLLRCHSSVAPFIPNCLPLVQKVIHVLTVPVRAVSSPFADNVIFQPVSPHIFQVTLARQKIWTRPEISEFQAEKDFDEFACARIS